MPYKGLNGFIAELEKQNELQRISAFVDPVLEIAELADRMIKSGGKALLMENTGTEFPILINAFGSDKRIALALGGKNPDTAAEDISAIFAALTGPKESFMKKISALPLLMKISRFIPVRKRSGGRCQQVVNRNPDLSVLPVLKCWPNDGGRFITLPVVHTVHPTSGKPNAGMYRMQILDSRTTAMHWQRHKTGAVHFAEWKKRGERMPVTVTLGGDPVYTYAATAPLPEDIDEFVLAGFLRKRRVKMVKCLTNQLYVPADADIVIEGYVDPGEDAVPEGPFGDHTGFYSLTDYYPAFHVTCITHSRDAVYPATIVGVPPMEDAWLAGATERIFLTPLKLALLPELEDMHMPSAGVAHNLMIVKIKKSYPGQGKKVIGSLLGAGQMMFTKYLAVVSGDVDIRDYGSLAEHILLNTSFVDDLQFTTGPLDVLDHASDLFTLGGKLGIDATVKIPGEEPAASVSLQGKAAGNEHYSGLTGNGLPPCITAVNETDTPGILVAAIRQESDGQAVARAREALRNALPNSRIRVILAVDDPADVNDLFTVIWLVLGNTDPRRDVMLLSEKTLFVDGTIKVFREGGFHRKWPNVVCSSLETIEAVDRKWDSLGLGALRESPSLGMLRLVKPGNAEIIVSG